MKCSYREIKKILLNKYNIYIKQEDLNIILKKISKQSKNNVYGNNLQKILYLYQNCTNTTKLCLYLNKKYGYSLNKHSLAKLAFQYNVCKKNKMISSIRRISKINEQEIVEKYLNGKNSYELAKEYGYKSHKTITDILKSHNISIRNYSEACENKKAYKDFDFFNYYR